MIIELIHVKNFRSIVDEKIFFDKLTVLVGPNGAGKSAFLRALDLFYKENFKITVDDFYNQDTSKEISIVVTFKDLSEDAKKLFNKYIRKDKLTIERVFTWGDGKILSKYHGAIPQNLDFKPIRDAQNATEAKEKYEEIRQIQKYNELPQARNQKQVLEQLSKWEETNPRECKLGRDDGQFFGFKPVAQGYLGRYTKLLFIEAVRDASIDATDNQGSVITDLLDLVVRSVIAQKEEIVNFKKESQEQYKIIMDPQKLTELSKLSGDMSKTLRTFVPNSGVKLEWKNIEELNIPLPKADIKLIEDEYESNVARVGHGLQRAFIITMLQHLIIAQKTEYLDEKQQIVGTLPNLILVIEEPELYQHPCRQRHLSKILLQLAEGEIPGVADKTQIIYCTHSALFVGIDRINQIRLIKKESYDKNLPRKTKVVSTNLDEIAKELWDAHGKPTPEYTGHSLLPRIKTIMTPWMNEGFFADAIVLVEGEDDRSVILGVARHMNIELESESFSIIPTYGKNNLDRPFLIFSKFGIPTYIIWDSDKGEKNAKPEDNHHLLKLMGEDNLEDWPNYVKDKYSCFEDKLETTLKKEIGEEDFEKWLKECMENQGITKRKNAIKNSSIIEAVVSKAQREGKESETLKNIIEKILILKN